MLRQQFDNLRNEQLAEFLGKAVINSAPIYPTLSDLEFEPQDMRWNGKPDSNISDLPTSFFRSQRAKNSITFGSPKLRFHTRDRLPKRFSKGAIEPQISDGAHKQPPEEGESVEDAPD